MGTETHFHQHAGPQTSEDMEAIFTSVNRKLENHPPPKKKSDHRKLEMMRGKKALSSQKSKGKSPEAKNEVEIKTELAQ